jgi:RES domain-containing protein
MLLYRLAKNQYMRDLSGTGARLYGGRWNEKGTSMLYTSEYCSLAVLELLVHTPHTLLPENIHLLTIYIPDDLIIPTISEDQLPANWQQFPAPDLLAEMGTQWAQENKTTALKVPSVLVPDEWNILLNPSSSKFNTVRIDSVQPFHIDSRF